MITMEIKINGVPIATGYAVNDGLLYKDEDITSYRCEIHEIDNNIDCQTFYVEHKREEGWKILIRKILLESIERERESK